MIDVQSRESTASSTDGDPALEHLVCLLDTVDRFRAEQVLPARDRMLDACPAPTPTWGHHFDPDRYPPRAD